MFSMLGAGEDAFRYAIYQVVSVCVWVILYLLSESSDWWLQHVEADALRTGSEDPFPTAALFTGRCNHIPARLPSCNPSTPSYCSTHTQTHTHSNTTSLSPQTWHPSIIHHCKERTENAERGREEELHSFTQLASHHTLHTQHTATNLQTSPSTHWQELKWNREVGWKEKESERERERRTEQTENRDEGETSNSIEISTKCFQVQFSSQSAKKKGKKSPSKCVSVWSQQWKWWSKPHKDKLSFWATHTASPSTIIDHLRTISSGVGWTLELLRGKEVMNKRKFVSETVHFHFVLKQRPEPLMCQLLHRYTQASEWDAHNEPPRQQRPGASVREKSRYSEILNTETFSTNKHTEGSKQKRYVCVFDLLLQDFPLLSCHDAVLTCWSGLGTNNT